MLGFVDAKIYWAARSPALKLPEQFRSHFRTPLIFPFILFRTMRETRISVPRWQYAFHMNFMCDSLEFRVSNILPVCGKAIIWSNVECIVEVSEHAYS